MKLIGRVIWWVLKMALAVLGVAFMICWVLLRLAVSFKQPTQSSGHHGHYGHGRH
jgi:hypothetical protein